MALNDTKAEIYDLNMGYFTAPDPNSEQFLPWANQALKDLKEMKELTPTELSKVQKALDNQYKERKRAGALLEKYLWRPIQKDMKNGIIF